MTPQEKWAAITPPLIAILRGIKPEETKDIVTSLLEVGFRAIEIPLNSPDPFASIEIAVKVANAFTTDPCLIGAGTVLNVSEAQKVVEIGGNLIVSPNADPEVIKASVALGAVSMPGVMTPTEAHLAIASGATGLKFFPASILGAGGIKAIKAILPPSCHVLAVGGADDKNFAEYMAAGAVGFGLGSSLYKAGMTAQEVRDCAEITLKAFNAIT